MIWLFNICASLLKCCISNVSITVPLVEHSMVKVWILAQPNQSTCSCVEIFPNLKRLTYMSQLILRGCHRGVMVKAMDCGIVFSEFELLSRYYVHFRTNTLGKGTDPLSSQLWVK